MKKKLLAVCVVMAVMLVACGGNDAKVISGDVTAVTESQDVAETTVEDAGEEEMSYKGYAYVYQDTLIEIDADAAPIIAALGEADSYFESPSCAFEGIDKTYTYGSIEIDTYPTDDKDYVSSIIFRDDSIVTLEGVGIGDSVDKVKEVYGADCSDEGGMLVYKKDDVKLCFIIQDALVAAIEYRSTVLDE